MPDPSSPRAPVWRRVLWAATGVVMLATGIVALFVPLLPTTPFVLVAAFCFARGSSRCERWLLTHPRLGPIVRDWREHHAVPWRAKQLAWAMMALGCAWAALTLPPRVVWAPLLLCAVTAVWLWRLPTRRG